MRNNQNNFRAFKLAFYMSILLSLFLFTYQVAAIEYKDSDVQETSMEQTITHDKIVNLTDQFMDRLVQEINEDYKVIHFDTKEALKSSFDTIANRDVTSEYIDFYYEEKVDGLYILPTEIPPWFIEKNHYDVIQLNGNQVKVIQENETDLYGDYIITYEFTYIHNEDWKITDISIT